ncbi:MAG TPA: hypothetical protein VF498_14630, partial [Anaerolineales bacterium]
MLPQLDQIEQAALSSLESVGDEEALQRWKVAHLGRSSPLMQTFDGLGDLVEAGAGEGGPGRGDEGAVGEVAGPGGQGAA